MGEAASPLTVRWLQRMAEIWQTATGQKARANDPKPDQPDDWRSPFHRFIMAAWAHMQGIGHRDIGALGSASTIRRALKILS